MFRERTGLDREDQRFSFVQIRDTRRILLDSDPSCLVEPQVAQHWSLKLVKKGVHPLLHFGDLADIGERPPAEFGSFPHEVAIGSGADPDREDPPVTQSMMQQFEQFFFIADLPVGEQNHLLQPVNVF